MLSAQTWDECLPVAIVDRQLQAYNARDIEAFIACWADTCEYFMFPSELIARGIAEVRDRHVQRFKEPDLFGTLHKRISVRDLVVDYETVTRTYATGVGEVDVIAIYQVEEGKIAKAWFKIGEPRMCNGHPPTPRGQ